MANTTAKLVLSLDAESQTYKPAGHNLSAEQAAEHVNKIQTDDGTAVVVEQQRHHRALSFHRCQPCKTAAENFLQERPEPLSTEEGGGQ